MRDQDIATAFLQRLVAGTKQATPPPARAPIPTSTPPLLGPHYIGRTPPASEQPLAPSPGAAPGSKPPRVGGRVRLGPSPPARDVGVTVRPAELPTSRPAGYPTTVDEYGR
jgi:hypothetical protein